MKEKEFDNIMNTHMKNYSADISIDQAVMSRIRKYEEKKSARAMRFEYILSAVVFLSGIISIFLIHGIFDAYIPIPQIEQYFSFSKWALTGMFGIIILLTVFVVYFSSLFEEIKK